MTIPLRTTLLFFTAYALNTTAHECAHALTAYFLGIRSTLFHFYVTPAFNSAEPAPRVLVAAAGPVFSLVFGLLCWVVYRKIRVQPSRLSWLYQAIFGISIFLGNLFSTSFVGDFGTVATLLNISPTVRLVVTITGLVLVCAFLYAMGQELVKWAPRGSSRTTAMIHMTVLPAVLGTFVVILAFLPMPAQFIVGWIVTSGFWVFAAGGAFLAAGPEAAGDARIRPFEYVAAALVLAAVRILAVGIVLAP